MQQDLGIIIAIVGSGLSIVGVMTALFLWNRGESNSDRRHHDDSMDSLKKDLDRINKRFQYLERRK
jgi:hypothetical protein